MVSVRYLFGDLDTREIIAELPLTGVSMNKKLNEAGIFRGTIHYDTSGISNQEIAAATSPGRSFVVAERGDTPIWDGIIWTSSYDSQAKVQNITARTYEAYPDKQIITTDFTRDNTEQRNIFRDLWIDLQSTNERNLGITVPSAFAPVLGRTLTVLASEYKTYGQVMSSISDGNDGFDWTITTIKQNNEYLRSLQIGYPVLGATDVAGLSFDYPGNITNYWKTSGVSSGATHLFMLGAGEGSSMIVSSAVQDDLIAGGMKRYDIVIARKDIDSQQQIDSLAAKLGYVRRVPVAVIKVMLKANLDPVFGSYGLGDAATVSILDPRHPEGLTTTARIVAFDYRPQSDDSVEQVELIFEGDELNE